MRGDVGARAVVALAALAAACGGDDGAGGDGGSGDPTVTRYSVEVAGAQGNVGLSRYPVWALSSGLYVTLGQTDGSGTLMTGVDMAAASVRFARHLPVQQLTALGADGAGGVIVVGRGQGMFAARFDRLGDLVWSNQYDDQGTPIGILTGLPGVFSYEAVSNVHDDKAALVILGNVVVVDVATGTPIWRRVIPGNVSQLRVFASDAGLWLIGTNSQGLLVVRLDWSGNLVGASVADTVPSGFSLGEPIPHDDGFLLSYLFKTGGTRSISYGILSLATDGTKRAQWSYRISGDRQVSPTGGVLLNPMLETEPFVLQPMSNDRFWVNVAAATYTGSGAYERTDLGFPISATGAVMDSTPAWDESRLVLADDHRYVAVRDSSVFTTGGWNTSCASQGIDITELEQTFDAQPPLVSAPVTLTLSSPPITTTAVPLAVMELTTTVSPFETCPSEQTRAR